MKFDDKIEKVTRYLNNILKKESSYSGYLLDAMKYSLNIGGKRIRPLLTILSYEIFRSDIERIIPVAAAIEMIHTYSLIHDDLPAMDNDDLRRGKPSNHKVFGEGMAILAGDGLLTLAFEVMGNAVKDYGLPMGILTLIARKSGPFGMVGGQACDLTSDVKSINSADKSSFELLEFIHLHKTADLICASVVSGALGGGAESEDIKSLGNFAEKIGLSFQITDDILDETGSSEKLGKSAGKDKKQNKLTYSSLYGIEKSREKAEILLNEALREIESFSEKAANLSEVAKIIIQRDF